jgi:outer membrane protein
MNKKYSYIKLLVICNFLLVLVILFYLFFSQSSNIVYIDSNKLLNGYKGMVEARKEYEKKRNIWQSNVDTLTKEVEDAIKKYSKDMALGTQKEKDLSKQLIQNKQKELTDYQNAIRQNASQEEARLNESVFSTVNSFLLRYGKKHHYKMILIAANGNMGYAEPSLDITDKIVEELNKEYTIPVK